MLFSINNSKTAWPTLILMLFLSSLDNLLEDAYIIFQKDIDNFEIEHKNMLILELFGVGGAVPRKYFKF